LENIPHRAQRNRQACKLTFTPTVNLKIIYPFNPLRPGAKGGYTGFMSFDCGKKMEYSGKSQREDSVLKI